MTQTAPYVVRPASPEDAPVIADFNAKMARETENRTLDPAVLQKGVAEVLADPLKGVYYVVELGGVILGQLLITYEWSDWRNGMFWWIQSVYVREDHRGKGVFKALYAFVATKARETPGICGLRLYVEAGNKKAQETYQRLGMKKTGYEFYEVDFVLNPTHE